MGLWRYLSSQIKGSSVSHKECGVELLSGTVWNSSLPVWWKEALVGQDQASAQPLYTMSVNLNALEFSQRRP